MPKELLAFVVAVSLALVLGGCAKDSVPEEVTEPVAGFKLFEEVHPAPCLVTFVNNSSGCSSVEWDFGDGCSSTENTPSHIYHAGGTYPVRLTVRNSTGAEDVTYMTVTIPGQPSSVKITGIEVVKIPDASPSGMPWDEGDDPDIFFFILDETNVPILMTGCVNNISNSQLPLVVESGLPLVLEEFTSTIRVVAYDRDTGADSPDDFIGGNTIDLQELLPKDGAPYPAVVSFNNKSNPLGFNVLLEWE